jgi:hypothetical protein
VAYRFSRRAAEDLEDLYLHGAVAFGVAQAEVYFAGLIIFIQRIRHGSEDWRDLEA